MASLLQWFKKRGEGILAQANPFDRGQTYNTVVNRPVPPPALGPRTVQAVQQGLTIRQPSGQLTGTSFNPIRTPFQVQGPAAPIVNRATAIINAPRIEKLERTGQI